MPTTQIQTQPTRTNRPHHPLRDEPRGLLTQAVRVVTGLPDAQPREGQALLHDAISVAMENRTHMVGQAPTGSGKSLASLAPAFMAAIRGERTIMSTDSLALMGQLQDKDVDTVTEAAAALFPEASVQVAFLKGVANYLDPDKVVSAGQKLSGLITGRLGDLADALEEQDSLAGAGSFSRVADDELPAFRDLVVWALRVYEREDENEPGDRHSCPIEHTPKMWQYLSASSSESSDGKRYGLTPKIQVARQRAAESDIVVTNHSMLAVQAAKAVPVVIGNDQLGVFRHIVVDEAHTLPGHVRSQGASVLSGQVIERAGKAVAAASNSGLANKWRDAGSFLAEHIDEELQDAARGERDGVLRMSDGVDVLGEYAEQVKNWVKSGSELLGNAGKDAESRAEAARAKEMLAEISATVAGITRHRTGWARWVEQSQPMNPAFRPWWEANVSPIDVAFLMRDNLWGTGEKQSADGEDEALVAEPISVSAISATMPSNFPHQAGLKAQMVKYPSPFGAAYGRSALYVPQVLPGTAEFAQVTREVYGKTKFHTPAHAEWAVEHIIDLVRAAGGRALVIAAKTADGKMYADRLRRALPDLKVYDQWEGAGVVSQWRADTDSVLVGSRSFATGIDPQGETCQLVIVDRVPRSPMNPIDDARVEALAERLGGKWEADRFVYVTDAALLLKQAVGRLIRASGDSGMVAILDPRLLKAGRGRRGPLTYQEQTREIYMETVAALGTKIASRGEATSWLVKHRHDSDR